MGAHFFQSTFTVQPLLESAQRLVNRLAFFQLNLCQFPSLPSGGSDRDAPSWRPAGRIKVGGAYGPPPWVSTGNPAVKKGMVRPAAVGRTTVIGCPPRAAWGVAKQRGGERGGRRPRSASGLGRSDVRTFERCGGAADVTRRSTVLRAGALLFPPIAVASVGPLRSDDREAPFQRTSSGTARPSPPRVEPPPTPLCAVLISAVS